MSSFLWGRVFVKGIYPLCCFFFLGLGGVISFVVNVAFLDSNFHLTNSCWEGGLYFLPFLIFCMMALVLGCFFGPALQSFAIESDFFWLKSFWGFYTIKFLIFWFFLPPTDMALIFGRFFLGWGGIWAFLPVFILDIFRSPSKKLPIYVCLPDMLWNFFYVVKMKDVYAGVCFVFISMTVLLFYFLFLNFMFRPLIVRFNLSLDFFEKTVSKIFLISVSIIGVGFVFLFFALV